MGLQITYDPCVAKPIIGMVPPGGYHYFQGDVRLHADTLIDLYKKVSNYRAENALPENSTKDDVDNYVCGQFPEFLSQRRLGDGATRDNRQQTRGTHGGHSGMGQEHTLLATISPTRRRRAGRG